MVRNERHVQPGKDGWDVENPGGRATARGLSTQKAAIDRARRALTGDGGGEIVIHRPDGSIRDSDTVRPGNDPNPPRDKK